MTYLIILGVVVVGVIAWKKLTTAILEKNTREAESEYKKYLRCIDEAKTKYDLHQLLVHISGWEAQYYKKLVDAEFHSMYSELMAKYNKKKEQLLTKKTG